MMTEPNWDQERPSEAEIEKLWNLNVFEEHPIASNAIFEIQMNLKKSHTNGDCFVVCAKYLNHPVLHWFVSRNRFDEISFFEAFLSSSFFHNNGITFDGECKPIWEWSSSYILDGDIARTLKSGGAYESFPDSGKDAKALGQKLCDDLFGDRYDEVQVFKTYTPWSPWFYDIAWDQTWIIVDKRSLLIWAIVLTDTD